ncbi:hypothetical protein ACOSP7_014891 [Xanthoceras sorbifolium]
MTWAGDGNVTKYCKWNTFTSRNDAMDFLQEVIRSHARCMAIYINDRPVGSILCEAVEGERSMEGRDWVCSERKVLGERDSKQLRWQFHVRSRSWECLTELKVWLLSIDVNVASQRVLGKAGVVKEGVRKKFFC